MLGGVMPYLSCEIKPNSHVLLMVSVGQEEQTGIYFNEMINLLIEQENIEKVTLIVGDEIQRFNIMIKQGVQEDEARSLARQAGDQWLLDNKMALESLKQCSKLGTLYRWDSLPDNFVEKQKEITLLYDNDGKFRNNVDSVAKNFARRMRKEAKESFDRAQRKVVDKKATFSFDYNKALQYMIDFLLEETAMVISLGTLDDVLDYRLYRGSVAKAMDLGYEKLGEPGRLIPTVMHMKGQKKNQTQPKTASSVEYAVPPVPQSPFFYPHHAFGNPLPQSYPRPNTLSVDLPEIELIASTTKNAFLLLQMGMFEEVLSKAHERSPEKDINQLFIKCMPDLIESMKENLKVLLDLSPPTSDNKSLPSMSIVKK